MELKNLKINFLGDSITEGHGVAEVENRFVNRVAAMTGAITRNYGVGGTRIARQTNPSANDVWDRDFIARAEKMDDDADIVVVFGGTNDFGHGDAKLGTMADRDIFTFYGATHTLITNLIAKYPEAQIVIMTPLHRLSEDVTVNEIGLPLETNLEGYVNIIKEVARYYSIPVLDLHAVSGMQPKVDVIKDRYMPDGLHPNDAGHKLLADKIVGFLKAL